MRTIHVSLESYGPIVLTFTSGAGSFLTNVLIAVEKLDAMGHSFDLSDMGKRFFLTVL